MTAKMVKLENGAHILAHCACGTDGVDVYKKAKDSGAKVIVHARKEDDHRCPGCGYWYWTWSRR